MQERPKAGRKVDLSRSRKEQRTPRAPKEPKEPKEKRRVTFWGVLGRLIATVVCLCIIGGSLLAVGAVYYVVNATADDGNLLDLDNIELSQSSVVVATDPDTGAQVEYATLRSSNSHRVWANLEQIPSYLQYAFICTEDKDFYNEPGVNFKRTIGAMVNEYILPIYSSKQGASTLEQQLIKNLTDDDSASGIEGALRKLREIYRALCLSRSYSKETILEAYLNTISFTGTIQGVQTAANEYFNKDVSQLTLWECASIASITKNPTNYNPYTNPENLIHRRNFLLYNMWQQGVISEEDYRNAAAQPLVLAEEDASKKNASTASSYFTDALFNEVVSDIAAKEGVDEATAQKMLYTGGYTIEATVNPKMQTAMENLMLNTDDAYFPAGWHEEEVTGISDDDVQVFNADGTPKTRTAEDGTVYYYRNVRTQAAMVTLDYDGNVLAMVGGLGQKTKSLSLNRAYSVTRQTGSTIKPIGAYSLGIEYGLVNWSTMLNNSQLAPQLRRQLRRQHRSPAVERSGPLPEHHRHPCGRPGGRKQYLQLCLQHPAAEHAGSDQRCGSGPDGHGQPDSRRDAHGTGSRVPDLLRWRVYHPAPVHPCAGPGRQYLSGKQRHQLSGPDPADGLCDEPPAEKRALLQCGHGPRQLPQLQRHGVLW